MAGIKNNIQIKREDDARLKQLKRAAKMEAFNQLQPALVQHIKEQEIKKLTGEDKKDKLAKFANAFSIKNDVVGNNSVGFDVESKLQKTMWQFDKSPKQQPYSRPSERNQKYVSRKHNISQSVKQSHINKPKGYATSQSPKQQVKTPKFNKLVSDKNYTFGNSFSQDKIDKMLGKKKGIKDKTVEDKLHDMLSR
jgi:hypothetical protein